MVIAGWVLLLPKLHCAGKLAVAAAAAVAVVVATVVDAACVGGRGNRHCPILCRSHKLRPRRDQCLQSARLSTQRI